ncbi:uncharacterized protein UTRI_05319_B [Ustilago trichophora]|uniref:Uncharacterized protein n=1 Tax=Ustilago trichophora TaxID=86804 RepID=A0A5C3EK73_9BASI|nr:uncharacterized protein UTRI_05319_B [Ustilago trichophora]
MTDSTTPLNPCFNLSTRLPIFQGVLEAHVAFSKGPISYDMVTIQTLHKLEDEQFEALKSAASALQIFTIVQQGHFRQGRFEEEGDPRNINDVFDAIVTFKVPRSQVDAMLKRARHLVGIQSYLILDDLKDEPADMKTSAPSAEATPPSEPIPTNELAPPYKPGPTTELAPISACGEA